MERPEQCGKDGCECKDSGICDDGYFESIYHNGKPGFLVKTKTGYVVKESVTFSGQTYVPKNKRQIPYEPYGYFTDPLPSLEIIFRAIRNIFDTFVDVDPIYKDVLSMCVLLTYQQDKMSTVPYLYFCGDNESGKSTVLLLLSVLCCRPLCGVSIPSADLYSYIEDEDSTGCILEDEIQGVDKDLEKLKIYKAGYKRGARVPRITLTETSLRGRRIDYYYPFCFKACAGEQAPMTKGFRERFILIQMVQGSPKKDWTDATEEDKETIRILRNMLLKWRLQTKSFPLIQPLSALSGRLKELWKPLLQIARGLSIFETLLRFAVKQKEERLSDIQETLDGHIVKTVCQLLNETEEPNGKALLTLPFENAWVRLSADLEGKTDTYRLNAIYTADFGKVTKQMVGRRLREVLDGRSRTCRKGERTIKVYEFDPRKVFRVVKKYGYSLVTELPMLPILEGAVENKVVSERVSEEQQANPTRISNISNVVTLGDIMDVQMTLLVDSYEKSCGVCGRLSLTGRTAKTKNQYSIPICETCAQEYFRVSRESRIEPEGNGKQ